MGPLVSRSAARRNRVGMPGTLWLHEFGSQLWSAFGHAPYLVGSVLAQMRGEDVVPNDVDVRVILTDEDYDAWGLGDPEHPHENSKWVSLVLAYSTLGEKMTGLHIDFQIQQQTHANATFPKGDRSAIGFVPLRLIHHP